VIAARETTNEPSGALQTVNAEPDPVTIDPNGNLTQKVEGTDTWGYEWDAANQLKRVLLNGTEVARFAYDPLGRRAEKVNGAITTAWTYEGEDILRETSGANTLKYVHGLGIDEPLATDDGVTLSYYHEDGLGSVIKTTNSAGAVTLTRQYDAWGNLQAGAPTPGYAFTGREWDPETNLYYYRARYYDPKAGRFVSEDPAGTEGGLNLYSYAASNPLNLTDPFGLKPGDPYGSLDEAAIAAAKQYNGSSILRNLEFAASLYCSRPGKYTYTEAKISIFSDLVHPLEPPTGKKKLAEFHTHGTYGQDGPSEPDRVRYNFFKIPGYVATPTGTLWVYNPKRGTKRMVFRQF